MYLVSLGAGILAGVVYGLINVRSPAPPAIALVGLLGTGVASANTEAGDARRQG